MTIWEWLGEDASRRFEITSEEVLLRDSDDEGRHMSLSYDRPEEIPRLLAELVIDMKIWELENWEYDDDGSLEAIFGVKLVAESGAEPGEES